MYILITDDSDSPFMNPIYDNGGGSWPAPDFYYQFVSQDANYHYFALFFQGTQQGAQNDIKYNLVTSTWEDQGSDYPLTVVDNGPTVDLGVMTFTNPYYGELM